MKSPLILTTTALLTGALAAMSPSSVSAGYNAGVKEVSFLPEPCAPAGSALPPGYGGAECSDVIGTSNTVYVVQHENQQGEYVFDEVVGTGAGGSAWLGFQLTAECRAGYRLWQGTISTGLNDSEGVYTPEEVDLSKWEQAIEIDTSHQTIPDRHIDIDFPLDRMHTSLANDGYLGTHDDLIEWAEDMVADEVAAGADEIDVRTQAYEADAWLPFNTKIVCRGTGLAHLKRQMFDSAWAPLHIVFLPQGVEPSEGWRDAEIDLPAPPARGRQTVGGGLSVGVAITQATLSAIGDPDDPCRIHLTGAIVVNQPTTVEYRFVDDLGVGSQWFSTNIDQTLTAMLDHHVDVEPASGGVAGPAFVIDEGPTGPFDYAVEATSRLQGWYRLEIRAPHTYESDVASYNLPPCTPSGEVNDTIGGGRTQVFVGTSPSVPSTRG